jgi:hypothetical protein
LAAKLVGRLGPVLLAHVLTNILVDASLHSKLKQNQIVSHLISSTVGTREALSFQ